jgi:hypothetical protein
MRAYRSSRWSSFLLGRGGRNRRSVIPGCDLPTVRGIGSDHLKGRADVPRHPIVITNETCIVIGPGPAGLAMSHCLRHGVPHIVFERGAIGERWRSERRDSFTLLSLNWQTRLRVITTGAAT